jgi:hypothetical protein
MARYFQKCKIATKANSRGDGLANVAISRPNNSGEDDRSRSEAILRTARYSSRDTPAHTQ